MRDITGGIMFFNPSLSLSRDGATATASSNEGVASFILNYEKDSGWISSGSTDGFEETITITLSEAKTFNRLFLLNHNFKDYSIQYGDNQDFTGVYSARVFGYGTYTDESGSIYTDQLGNSYIDGESNGFFAYHSIAESNYNQSASYYEFDEITTDTIIIRCGIVQNASELAEKFLASLILTTPIGRFHRDGVGRPSATISGNNRIARNINNKALVQRGLESFRCSINAEYLNTQNDIDLFTELFERNEDFLMWLCGGRFGSPYFRFDAKPYRLVDLYRVRNVGDLDNNFYKNLYNSGITATLNLVEVEG